VRRKEAVWLAIASTLAVAGVGFLTVVLTVKSDEHPWTQPLMFVAYVCGALTLLIFLILLFAHGENEPQEELLPPRIMAGGVESWNLGEQAQSGVLRPNPTTPVSFRIKNVGGQPAEIEAVEVQTAWLDKHIAEAHHHVPWKAEHPPVVLVGHEETCSIYLDEGYDVLPNTRFIVTVRYHAKGGAEQQARFAAEYLGSGWKLVRTSVEEAAADGTRAK